MASENENIKVDCEEKENSNRALQNERRRGISFKEQFQTKNLRFSYEKRFKFSSPEWRGRYSISCFFFWRFIWIVWHIFLLIYSISEQGDKGGGGKWFIFLHNLGYLLLSVQTLVHASVFLAALWGNVNSYFINGDKCLEAKWYEEVLWFLTEISFDTALVVTIMYWSFGLTHDHILHSGEMDFLAVSTHVVQSFYVLSDMFISASPMNLLHFVYPSFFVAAYSLFTLFYYLAGGTDNRGETNVYPIFDWSSDPGMATLACLLTSFLLTPLVHLFRFQLYTFRVFLSAQYGLGRPKTKKSVAQDMLDLAELNTVNAADSEPQYRLVPFALKTPNSDSTTII